MTTFFRAPTHEENVSGPREFAYVAEVDITGWKFRLMYDGTLQIDLPTIEPDPDGLPVMPMLAASPGTTAILQALLNSRGSDAKIPVQFTEDARGLGRVL